MGRPHFLYVANFKLATGENINYIARQQGRFFMVLRRSRKEDQQFGKRWVKIRLDSLGQTVHSKQGGRHHGQCVQTNSRLLVGQCGRDKQQGGLPSALVPQQ